MCFKQESLLPVHTKSAVKNVACLKLLWHGPGQSWPDLCLEDSWCCTTKASPNLTGTDGLHTSFAASARKSEAHHRLLPRDGWAETVGRSGCTLEPNPTRYLDERWHLMTLFFFRRKHERICESIFSSNKHHFHHYVTMLLLHPHKRFCTFFQGLVTSAGLQEGKWKARLWPISAALQPKLECDKRSASVSKAKTHQAAHDWKMPSTSGLDLSIWVGRSSR